MKTHHSLSVLVAVCLLSFASCGSQKATDPTEAKIDSLLTQMTLDEKIGQMNQLTGMGISDDMKQQIKEGKVGSILNEVDVNIINELQRVAVEESRLHIPIIFGRDVIHGYKTIFPIPLGQAASWNTQLAEEGARIAAQEAGIEGLEPVLEKNTAIAVAPEDPVAVAKIICDFAKENKALVVKAGVLDGKVIDDAAIKALAELPPKEVLVAKMLGSMNAPISGFVNVLQGTIRNVVYALEAVRKQKESA